MKLTRIAAATILAFSSLAQADTLDLGWATLTYAGNDFGSVSSWSTNGFSWTVPNSANVVSNGSLMITSVTLPSFTLAAHAGYTLNGAFSAFLGNLAYTEVGGATTGILAYADVALNGGPATSLSGGVGWVSQVSGPGINIGYFTQTAATPDLGNYNSITVSNASIVLSATGGTFSTIQANNQNRLSFEFQVAPAAVPEPETYALLLAGLGMVGFLARRRQQR